MENKEANECVDDSCSGINEDESSSSNIVTPSNDETTTMTPDVLCKNCVDDIFMHFLIYFNDKIFRYGNWMIKSDYDAFLINNCHNNCRGNFVQCHFLLGTFY